MNNHPYIPLRWYEHLLIELLIKSPRISRIVIEQHVTAHEDEGSLESDVELFEQLENLYHGPSAEEYREG